jgi:hypothetical protein
MPTNLLRVAGDPLLPRNIESARTELEQTAVAVSVVGTSRFRLKQLSELVKPIAEALHGSRPEVSKLRGRLRRAAHNMLMSSLSQRPASEKIRALAEVVADVLEAVRDGIGNTSAELSVAGFEVVNVWGYKDDELRPTLAALKRVADEMSDVGLGIVQLGAELTGDSPTFALYLQDRDALEVNPSRAISVTGLLEALAERIWVRSFSTADHETWGGKFSVSRFKDAFAKALTGWKLDRETAARLQVTVGKLAAKWPEAA